MVEKAVPSMLALAPGPGQLVVTAAGDSGKRYLSGDLFGRDTP